MSLSLVRASCQHLQKLDQEDLCSPCPFLSVYSQEECLPENWKNCHTGVRDFCLLVFICPSVLSASVGLHSGFLAQSGSLGKAGCCV